MPSSQYLQPMLPQRSCSPTSSSSSSSSDIASPPLQNAKTQDVFNSIVKGRKSWKTIRGGEVVWPPELEAALIEGLEHYVPDDSRETRLLGRFPMRNRFISDYIFQKTGKRRTAKQVGSRLQQLRDTCGGRQLLNLLTPHRTQNRTSRPSPLSISSAASDSDSSTDGSVPPTPTEAHATLQSLLYKGVGGLGRDEEPNHIIYIDLLPENAQVGSNATQPLPSIPSSSSTNIVRASERARRICDIDPTVTLVAHSSMVAKSHFMVRTRTGVVHSEVAEMTHIGPVPEGDKDQQLYSTKLVPKFWDEICQSSDPTQFTITQKVTQEPYHDTSTPIFFAAYKFTLPSPQSAETAPTSVDSFMITEPIVQGSPKIGFGLDDLLTFDSDAFADLMPFSDKSVDLYDLDACLPPEWTMHSPATSISSDVFSECLSLSPSLTEIPTVVL